MISQVLYSPQLFHSKSSILSIFMRYTYRVTQNNNYRNRSTQSDIRQGTTNRSYWVMTCETGLNMADLSLPFR